MDNFGTLKLEQRDGVAILTLDNPERRNAMTPELTDEFPRAIAAVRADDGLRALILTNSGSTFCAGGDLRTLETQTGWTPEQNRRFMSDFYRSYLSVLSVDIPVIAALNGHAIGAGMSMTLGCDLRFASETARFGFTYLNLGLHPGMGTTHLLPMVVGEALAADLMLTCRLVGAAEALQIGLVSRVYPADRLLEESLAVAREMARRSPSGVRMAKRALAQRKLAGLEAALDYEATAQMGSFASDEMKAALAELRKGS
jgi:enoyl-CoA hydratase/carnithine racemase